MISRNQNVLLSNLKQLFHAILIYCVITSAFNSPSIYAEEVFSDYYQDVMGITKAKDVFNATGEGIRFGLIDDAINIYHAGFKNAKGRRLVKDITSGYYQGNIFIQAMCLPGNKDRTCNTYHGTANMGIVGAQEWKYGEARLRAGIAPDADLVFVTSERNDVTDILEIPRRSENNLEFVESLRYLMGIFQVGDVILIEGTAGDQPDFIKKQTVSSLIQWPFDFANEEARTLVKQATDKGITIVMTAGNSGVYLDQSQEYLDYVQSEFHANNGIIVGAINPDKKDANDFYTRHEYSNYGSFVHLNAWGEFIETTGWSPGWFGLADYSYFPNKFPAEKCKKCIRSSKDPKNYCGGPCKLGSKIPDIDIPAYSDISLVKKKLKSEPDYYTKSFGGTSGAAAIVAGIAVSLQSYAKRELKAPLCPEIVKTILQDSGDPSLYLIGYTPNLYDAIELVNKINESEDSEFILKTINEPGAAKCLEIIYF